MDEFNIEVVCDNPVKLPIAGKYCDRNIVLTSIGDSSNISEAQWIALIEGDIIFTKLPEGITSIGDFAFRKCTNLVLTSLPESVINIKNSAFSGTSIKLTSLPNGITSIGYCAFSGCNNLVLTSLPESITSIDQLAFNLCKGLTNLTFKGTPNSIANNAFKSCTNLLTINVPWAEGEVANAPWGATNATINYNYTGG